MDMSVYRKNKQRSPRTVKTGASQVDGELGVALGQPLAYVIFSAPWGLTQPTTLMFMILKNTTNLQTLGVEWIHPHTPLQAILGPVLCFVVPCTLHMCN